MKLLMHQKLILVIGLIGIGCFLAVKFSIWFLIIPVICSILIFSITKAKDVLKIVVPIVALLIGGAFAFAYFSGPSMKDLNYKLHFLENDLSKMKTELSEKQKLITAAKKEQGWVRSTFNDSEKVDYLEQERNNL